MKKIIQNKTLQVVILSFLCLFFLFTTITSGLDLIDLIEASVASILITIAIFLLIHEKHYFAAHSILFLLVYANGLFDFIQWLLSFNFETFSFGSDFSWSIAFFALAGLYLLLTSLIYLFNGDFTFNKKNFKIDQLILFFYLLIFLDHGIYYFIFVAVVEFIAINYKKLASLSLMLAKSIAIPFTFGKLVWEKPLLQIPIFNYFLLLLAFYVIFLIINKMIYYLTKKH